MRSRAAADGSCVPRVDEVPVDCGEVVAFDPAANPPPLCDEVLPDGTCCPPIALPPRRE
jgi:hypothetical protein